MAIDHNVGWEVGDPQGRQLPCARSLLDAPTASTSDVKRHLSLFAATDRNPLPRGVPLRCVSTSLLLEDVCSINWDDTSDRPARLSKRHRQAIPVAATKYRSFKGTSLKRKRNLPSEAIHKWHVIRCLSVCVSLTGRLGRPAHI